MGQFESMLMFAFGFSHDCLHGRLAFRLRQGGLCYLICLATVIDVLIIMLEGLLAQLLG